MLVHVTYQSEQHVLITEPCRGWAGGQAGGSVAAHVLVPASLFSPRSRGNAFESHHDRVFACHSPPAHKLLVGKFSANCMVCPSPRHRPHPQHSQPLPAEGMGLRACRCGFGSSLGGRSRMYRLRLARSAEGARLPHRQRTWVASSLRGRGWWQEPPTFPQGPAGCIPQTAGWFAGQFLFPTQP